MFTALNAEDKTLPERAADQVISMIVDGTFKPGDKLPGEYDLAQRLNVGRSTVREAIKSLVSQNILEVRRGNGTFVKERTGVVDDPLGFRFAPDKLKLGLDLCEIRLMIEPDIASIAAQKATEQEMDQMQAACDQVKTMIRRGENHMECDVEFHTMLARCTRNSVIYTLIPIINQAIPYFINITRRELVEQTIETHQQVLDAVRVRDGHAAAEAMRRHLEYNRRNIENAISMEREQSGK